MQRRGRNGGDGQLRRGQRRSRQSSPTRSTCASTGEPNRHIAFGAGVHRCLGSHLARRELRIAFREWHRRIPDYSIKPGHEELEYPPGLRSVRHLTLVWPT